MTEPDALDKVRRDAQAIVDSPVVFQEPAKALAGEVVEIIQELMEVRADATHYKTSHENCSASLVTRLEELLAAEARAVRAETRLAALDIEHAITGILNSVMELPDRSSPEDWPEACLVEVNELDEILRSHLIEYPAELLVEATPPPDARRSTEAPQGGEGV